jgi:hypothetical protein
VELARSVGVLKSATVIIIAALVLGPRAGAASGSAPASGLSVTTNPAGAAVYVDGQFAGRTPISVGSITAGDHRVRVVKDGYLENARLVTLPAGRVHAVAVTLTPATGGESAPQVVAPRGGGSKKKWLWIGLAAGGGTAAALVATNRNKPPTCGNVVTTPPTGLQTSTNIVVTAEGCSDPEGKELSYQWDLGDGGTGSGQTTTRVYATAGTFSPTVTVSDGKLSASASGSVLIRAMTGTWVVPTYFNSVFTMTQSGSTISGTYRADFTANTGTLSGTVQPNNAVRVTVNVPGFVLFSFVGTVGSTLNTWSGNITDLASPATFVATRQ